MEPLCTRARWIDINRGKKDHTYSSWTESIKELQSYSYEFEFISCQIFVHVIFLLFYAHTHTHLLFILFCGSSCPENDLRRRPRSGHLHICHVSDKAILWACAEPLFPYHRLVAESTFGPQ